jgi:hypothetical protein
MNTSPTPTEPETKAEQLAQDEQYYRRILHRMIDRGDAMAEMIHQKAKAQAVADSVLGAEASPTPAPDLTVPLDRVARMVRRCILLARKVSEPVKATTSVDAEQRRIAARKQVIRRVEDAIQTYAGDHEAEALHAELLERVDAPEFAADLAQFPIDEVITAMQADMGLLGKNSLDHWKRRTPRDIATLSARAAAPSREKLGLVGLKRPPRDWIDPEWKWDRPDQDTPRSPNGP